MVKNKMAEVIKLNKTTLDKLRELREKDHYDHLGRRLLDYIIRLSEAAERVPDAYEVQGQEVVDALREAKDMPIMGLGNKDEIV
jgi:hypothetical protein